MSLSRLLTFGLLMLTCVHLGCVSQEHSAQANGETWALAIHAGAGVIEKSKEPHVVDEYHAALASALSLGESMLASGATAMDTAQAVVVMLEDNPLFNAGKGAVFNAEGGHELDASIMDGSNLNCGAVAGVKTIKNPILLARRVMEETPHVLLAGEGAELFADSQPGITRVDQSYFFSQRRFESLQKKLKRDAKRLGKPELKSTVGCVVCDSQGNLAAATSTGGMTGKRFGRIGDSPIIGAGTYAANDACAISCTGSGEEYIRHGVARDVADRMRYSKVPLQVAAHDVVHEVLKQGDGGLIGVDRDGHLTLEFNTLGMFRAAGNSKGLHMVAIWEDPLP